MFLLIDLKKLTIQFTNFHPLTLQLKGTLFPFIFAIENNGKMYLRCYIISFIMKTRIGGNS